MALEAGIVLGRYDRCVGCGTEAHDNVSRVHSVLIAIDGSVFIADAGSTNGTWLGEREVKCAPVAQGSSFTIGNLKVSWIP